MVDSISRYDYFIGSMKEQAHYARDWMLRALAIVVTPVEKDYPWALRHTKDRVEVFAGDGDGYEWVTLEGAVPYQVPFVYHEVIENVIKPGDVENLKDRTITGATWGDLIFNSRVLVFSSQDRIPYVEGPINLGSIEKIFQERMRSNPTNGEPMEDGELYVKNWVAFGKAIGDLCGYEFLIPSVTEHALQAPPGTKELRDKLLEQYKDQLDDPVVQTKIQTELVNLYKEHLKGDPSEGFIYKNKSISTALKRMFLIHGPEAGFNEGGRAKLVVNSLSEGLDMSNYPAMVNSLRAGSYYRGALTALAGEDVDLTGRIFQNVRVQAEFCGTTGLLPVRIDGRRVGRTFLIDGEHVKITKDNLQEFTGQVQGMFAPTYCWAPHSDCCAVCFGDKIAAYPTSVGSIMADVQSVMMYVMMGSAHAKELKTTPLDLENFLR